MNPISAETRRQLTISASAVWLLFFVVVAIVSILSSCGAAGSVSTGVACSTLLTAIGAADGMSPERAHADIDSVQAVCGRLAPDAGVADE